MIPPFPFPLGIHDLQHAIDVGIPTAQDIPSHPPFYSDQARRCIAAHLGTWRETAGAASPCGGRRQDHDAGYDDGGGIGCVLKGRPRSNETQFLSFIAIRFEKNLQAIHVVLPEMANVIASSHRFYCRPKPNCGSPSDSRCASVGVSE